MFNRHDVKARLCACRRATENIGVNVSAIGPTDRPQFMVCSNLTKIAARTQSPKDTIEWCDGRNIDFTRHIVCKLKGKPITIQYADRSNIVQHDLLQRRNVAQWLASLGEFPVGDQLNLMQRRPFHIMR